MRTDPAVDALTVLTHDLRKAERDLLATRLERDTARASVSILSRERDELRGKLTATREELAAAYRTAAVARDQLLNVRRLMARLRVERNELWTRLRFAETPADPEVSYLHPDTLPRVRAAAGAYTVTVVRQGGPVIVEWADEEPTPEPLHAELDSFARAHQLGAHRGRPREGCPSCEVQLDALLPAEQGCAYVTWPADTGAAVLCGVLARHHAPWDEDHPYRATPDLDLGPVDRTRGTAP